MRESSLSSGFARAVAANDAQCLTLIDGQVNAVQRHKRLAEQPLVGADDGVRVLLAAHTGPPALQVVGQRASADLAELVLLFQPRDLDDRAFFICRHSYAPLSYTVSIKVFSMRLNSTTPKTSAAAVKIRLYTMPNVVTVPVPKVAMRKISIGDVIGLS